ncbi:MAG: hypothetical protein R2684_08580 [Pyrinomonadaceae bacterium]
MTNSVICQTDAIQTRVAKYGVGKNVNVVLNNGEKYKGTIKAFDSNGFSVAQKGGAEKTFGYSEVKSVNKTGISKAVWITIGAAAAGAVIFAATIGRRCRNEGANSLCL